MIRFFYEMSSLPIELHGMRNNLEHKQFIISILLKLVCNDMSEELFISKVVYKIPSLSTERILQ